MNVVSVNICSTTNTCSILLGFTFVWGRGNGGKRVEGERRVKGGEGRVEREKEREMVEGGGWRVEGGREKSVGREDGGGGEKWTEGRRKGRGEVFLPNDLHKRTIT